VDLGAAPGGWTWQLAQRGLRVVAVDNGALKGAVAEDPRVTHVRADGLTFRPRKPVDWVTCDIVESPAGPSPQAGAIIAASSRAPVLTPSRASRAATRSRMASSPRVVIGFESSW